jgi:FkbM family methyltransferase
MPTFDQPQKRAMKIRKRGKSFYVRRGCDDRFWQEVANDQWETYTFDIFDRFINCDYSYIDIGAWIGPTILYGCQIAKKAYGVEPDPIAYSKLLANVHLNQPLTENIELFDVCIAPQSGQILLGNRREGGDSMSSILFNNEKRTWTVKGMTFDSFVEENGIDDCNFIKMDIEGGEYLVIPTMKNYLLKHRPTLYVKLHPGFLGKREKLDIANRILRVFLRFISTLRILNMLNFYGHLYDVEGNEISPFSLLIKCTRSTFLPVVFTDIDEGILRTTLNRGTPNRNLARTSSL